MTAGLAFRPKVELHLHLEGCLTPAEAVVLARRHGLQLGKKSILALYRHRDFGEFLRHFGQLLDLFKGQEDLAWLLSRVLGRLRRQGVVYAEIRVSPAVWERHGLHPVPCLKTLLALRHTAPLPFNLIVDAVRQWDRALLERDLDLACAYKGQGVVAFGLGGDEAAAPAARFGDLARECRSRRLPVVPHAGEAADAGEVASAMKVFSPRRIGHGIAAARSEAVLADVVERGVHLEVCPTSNRRTGVIGSRERHPLGLLWRRGVHLSLGTDDPALFGATPCGELRFAALNAGWTLEDMGRSQVAAARASFLPPGAREALARRLEAGWPL